MTTMPDFYLPPYRTPLYWQDEESGVLRSAVMAFMAFGAGETPEPAGEHLELVIEYLRYYINAPCWKGDELVQLREQAGRLKSADDILEFMDAVLAIGLDPF